MKRQRNYTGPQNSKKEIFYEPSDMLEELSDRLATLENITANIDNHVEALVLKLFQNEIAKQVAFEVADTYIEINATNEKVDIVQCTLEEFDEKFEDHVSKVEKHIEIVEENLLDLVAERISILEQRWQVYLISHP